MPGAFYPQVFPQIPAGRLTRHHSLTNRAYDLDGNLTQVDSSGLNTYTFDDAFRITANTDTANSANTWSYGYDSLDRLTSASKTALTQSWSFDANGNRLTEGGTSCVFRRCRPVIPREGGHRFRRMAAG